MVVFENFDTLVLAVTVVEVTVVIAVCVLQIVTAVTDSSGIRNFSSLKYDTEPEFFFLVSTVCTPLTVRK